MYAAPMMTANQKTTILEQRQARGWSRARLAREAGITEQTIYRAEHGRNVPADDTVRAIADAFGVQPEVLIPERAHDVNLHAGSVDSPDHQSAA